MNITGKITLDMKPVNQILKAKGLTAGGDVQRFHTQNVLRRIQKHMPYRSGALIKETIASSPISEPRIVVPGPTGKYLYYGKVMVGTAPKVATDKPLNYTKTKNPLAGPYWDRALKAAELPAMQADLQRYVSRKAGR